LAPPEILGVTRLTAFFYIVGTIVPALKKLFRVKKIFQKNYPNVILF
jgi:hypothetical protein